MRLDYIPDGSADSPLIRLFDFTTPEAGQLMSAIADLVEGRREQITVESLGCVESVAGCKLKFQVRFWDQGVLNIGPAAFEYNLTTDAWEEVMSLIEPFANSTATGTGYQWLDQGPGEARLLLSHSGEW